MSEHHGGAEPRPLAIVRVSRHTHRELRVIAAANLFPNRDGATSTISGLFEIVWTAFKTQHPIVAEQLQRLPAAPVQEAQS